MSSSSSSSSNSNSGSSSSESEEEKPTVIKETVVAEKKATKQSKKAKKKSRKKSKSSSSSDGDESDNEKPIAKASKKKGKSKKPWKARKLVLEIDTGIEVSVNNPTIASKKIGKYVQYDVTGNDKHGNFNCKRRYSAFKELRNKLTENWPGIFIPPLPEKKKIGNFDAEFLSERTYWLNAFMQRCAKLPHIFYSEEMQVFLRSANESVTKFLSGIKRESPSKMLTKYSEHFDKFIEATGQKTEESVNKYFNNLDKTINFFKEYRNIAKRMRDQKHAFKLTYLKFINYTIVDYKNKLRSEEREKLDSQHKSYIEEEKKDDLSDFLKNLKELQNELTSFEQIKKDIVVIRKITEKTREKQTSLNNELSKIRSSDSQYVKEGMFKKVPKAEKMMTLENDIKECTDDLEALVQLRTIIYNLLNFQEFPRLIDVKRRTFAVGLTSYASMREATVNLELDLLKSIQDHYVAYIDN